MKTRIIAVILFGIIVFGVSAYVHDQMYDCLNPPMWIKIPSRYHGMENCLQMYADDTLPDWTQAREDYAKKQAHRTAMIELYSDKPEVVTFYGKYDDANVSVRDDHVSYFAGDENGFQSRMNLYFDQSDELTHRRFYCF